MLSVLRDFTSNFVKKCALKDFFGASWFSWSLVALYIAELCFWPARTRKNFELFELQACLWPGAQIWFSHKWRKLVAASLVSHCIDGYSCLHYWKEFRSATFQVLDWKLFVLHFDGNACNLVDFKSAWTETCMNCSNFFLFWGHQFSSIVSSRFILVCSSKMLVLFNHRFLYYQLTSFSKVMQLLLHFSCVFQPIYRRGSDENLWLLLKTK